MITWFNEYYPIWECPQCCTPNRYANTFGEVCKQCGENHTLDWHEYIINESIRRMWLKSYQTQGPLEEEVKV